MIKSTVGENLDVWIRRPRDCREMPACHPPAEDSLDLGQGHVLAGQKPPDKSLAAKCGPAQDGLPFPFDRSPFGRGRGVAQVKRALANRVGYL